MEQYIKELELDYLSNVLQKLEYSYRYLLDQEERECEFLRQLISTVEQIEIVLYVYARDKSINELYVKERLDYAKAVIDNTLRYYDMKARLSAFKGD